MQNANFLNFIPAPVLAILILIIIIWQLFWKAYALWTSANYKQRNWFIALFILIPLNDIGIVSLIYLFRFANKRLTIKEVKFWLYKIRKANFGLKTR